MKRSGSHRALPGAHGIGFELPEDWPAPAAWSLLDSPDHVVAVEWMSAPRAEARVDDGNNPVVFETGADFQLWFPGICEVWLAKDLRRIRIPRERVELAQYVPLIVEGTVLAYLLSLSGATVLHASAVRIGERLLAIAGDSGTGKSTLAAGLVLEGASVVTDDVFPIWPQGGRLVTRPGAHALRMRPEPARILPEKFPEARFAAATADERQLLMGEPARGVLPVDAVVLLGAGAGAGAAPRLTRLLPEQALLALTSKPRSAAFRNRTVLARDFACLAQCARVVPCLALDIGGTPMLDAFHEVSRQLRRELGAAAR